MAPSAASTPELMGKTFRKARNLPTWRRIALNAWDAPKEASIHGSLDIDAQALLQYIADARQRLGVKVTITHAVAKAVALAIARMPEANGIVSRGNLYLRSTVDIFLQVSLDEGESLSGATIRNADKKTVEEIARELQNKVAGIRAHQDSSTEKTTKTMSRIPGRLLSPMLRFLSWVQYDHDVDLSRLGIEKDMFGSAMVTNVGTFGLQQGYPPVFPLGRTGIVVLVGEVAEKAVVIDGKVKARPVLSLHATLDHRLVDGFHAGVLASRMRSYLLHPETLDAVPG